jgi:hypothetical protein
MFYLLPGQSRLAAGPVHEAIETGLSLTLRILDGPVMKGRGVEC